MNGSEEQKARQAAGVLPMREAIDGMADEAFAPLGDRPRYTPRRCGATPTAVVAVSGARRRARVSPTDVVVSSENAQMASAEQWAVVQDVRPRAGRNSRSARARVVIQARHASRPRSMVFGVLLTMKHGPFVLRREYEVDDLQQAACVFLKGRCMVCV